MDKISYVTKLIEYYSKKGFNATVLIENKRSGVIDSHGTINGKVLADHFKPQVEEEVEGLGANWFLGDRENFPRSMGLVSKVLADAHKTTKYGTKVMGFWRKECNLKMGQGDFFAWRNEKADVGRFLMTASILEKFPGFEMTMSDLVDWSSLYKCYGFSNVSPSVIKKESGLRSWVDVVRVFVEWSMLVLGLDPINLEMEDYSEGDSDFETPAKTKKTKTKTMPVKKSDVQKAAEQAKRMMKPKKSREEIEAAARERVRKVMAKRKETGGADKELELAMALSISDMQEQVSHQFNPDSHHD